MVRTRFAPSPTGSLHVGNARQAVLNWLITEKEGGQFILRIEDTDTARNVAGAEQQIVEDLSWLGLDWEEGPTAEGVDRGQYGPYRQSQRNEFYREYALRLLASGKAYHCYCTQAELDASRDAAIGRGEPARYPGTCRDATPEQVARWEAEGRPAALRFRMPLGQAITVHDIVYGDVNVQSDEIGDFIILRSDGQPTYNFAVVVDDLQMEITHVIRGVGHLSNTPRQVVLYQAFESPEPAFAHVPMVLGEDRQKLSKRHGAQALADYRRQGYHPDALVNYLSLLGWSSPTGEEVLTPAQLIEQVSLDRIRNADVVFDPAKLAWLSGKHIERLSLDELVEAVKPFVDGERFDLTDDLMQVAVAATRSHLTRFSEINEQLAAFFPSGVQAGTAAPDVVRAAITELEQIPEWSESALADAIKAAGKTANAKGRTLYEPLRIALTGREHGPPFTAVLLVQGRQRVLDGLRAAEQGAQ